uniref:Terpene synthase 5 n=1 Tax=Cananga odorata TaxID=13393 RepID=A0A7G5KLV4_CANOD|nr:terpene synthase 5 [Cananga odorata]
MKKSIQALVEKTKEEIFSENTGTHHFVSASAYDTAWLAMIPDPEHPSRPMFPQCLDWILHNQQGFGFWGEPNHSSLPTLESILATLACVAALKTWDVGHDNTEKGLAFLHAKVEKLLSQQRGGSTRWFAIVFPGMLECAWSKDVKIFPTGMPEPAKSIFFERKLILDTEKSTNQVYQPPLIFFLEALPQTYQVDCNNVLEYLNEDGSLFQSPSATAAAYMLTENKKCRHYLESLVQRCGSGVPPVYPVDEDLIKLCIVERLERLGLDEHFHPEIKAVLEGVYRKQKEQVGEPINGQSWMLHAYKSSLAYRLLTMHGYRISPSIFSSSFQGWGNNAWNADQSRDFFLSTMLNVYRASDFIFAEKDEAREVKSLAHKLLTEGIRISKAKFSTPSNLVAEVEHELSVPWLARLDHLEHRECIERGKTYDLWPGKASNLRIPCLNSDSLLELARNNYNHRQLTYRRELEELKRWVKDHGLCSLGFGREKTSYIYFAVATTMYPTYMSGVRMTAAKNGLLLTIIDDFFDCCAALDELKIFTDAIERWDAACIDGRGRVLFDALDAAIKETAMQVFHVQGRDVTHHLRDIWREVVKSWLKEAEWASNGYRPSVAEYLKNASISCAPQTSVLSSMYLVGPILNEELIQHADYNKLTDLLMLSCRLLNDVQTHEKEGKEGTPNLVLLLMEGNTKVSMEKASAYIKKILDKAKHELVELVLMDDKNCVPKPCRRLHLNVTTIFQMFYNSANVFDSPTALLQSINKAIYDQLPPEI